MMETLVHFFGFPREVLGVLGHFETGSSHTSCVHCLTRSKKYAVVLEEMDCPRLTAHVRHLAATPATVGFQFLRIVLGELVLEGTRQGDVARNRPCFLACGESALFRELIAHVLHFIAVRSTHDEHVIDHLLGDTIFDSYHAVRTGDSYHFGAEFHCLLSGAPCYVSEARESDPFAFNIFACLMEQMLREIQSAVTGSLRTEDRTAPRHALTGEDTCMIFACELLVHAVEESYLTSANADVSCRDVLIRTDATPQFEHESLAETHDLCVGFADRIKVRATFGTAHRKGRQRVLESLLEAQELEHRRRHSSVETQTAFVRTDSGVELHAVTEVRLHFALVINPRHAEREDTVGFNHTLHDLSCLKLGVLVVHLFNRLQHFLYCLQILCFTRMFRSQLLHNVLYFHKNVCFSGYYIMFIRVLINSGTKLLLFFQICKYFCNNFSKITFLQTLPHLHQDAKTRQARPHGGVYVAADDRTAM